MGAVPGVLPSPLEASFLIFFDFFDFFDFFFFVFFFLFCFLWGVEGGGRSFFFLFIVFFLCEHKKTRKIK